MNIVVQWKKAVRDAAAVMSIAAIAAANVPVMSTVQRKKAVFQRRFLLFPLF